jgi:hypothetical protein
MDQLATVLCVIYSFSRKLKMEEYANHARLIITANVFLSFVAVQRFS